MLHLAPSQIYTLVFHLWKSVALTMPGLKILAHLYPFFSLACFRAFSDAAHSSFWCRDPKVCLRGSLKMLLFALHQMYTNVFHLWKSVDLDSA